MGGEARNILNGELIGLDVVVIGSKNKANIGLRGKITNETKKTITIDDKMVFKKNVVLEVGKLKIEGERLVGRPEDRIKVRK